MTEKERSNELPMLQAERIEISGGRYLIYYTFDAADPEKDSTEE